MHNIVIIGAGLSGRGYLNRLLCLSNERVTFLDQNEELIEQLQKEKQYTIAFGEERERLIVNNFDAYTMQDKQASKVLSNADYIFICVGANHVKELLEPIKDSLVNRAYKSLDIIVAENGIHPSAPLTPLKEDERVQLSEAVIFCTTLGTTNSLAIFSENLDHLPYDCVALGHTLDFYGFIQEHKFPILLERKIYTYNCISACIAYLGYIKGYKDYAKAANDVFIDEKIKEIAEIVNQSIAKEYNIPLKEQEEFSIMAMNKFKNKNIVDTVERNVRDVERKLAKDERILAPLCIIEKHGLKSDALLEVCACALQYGIDTNTLSCKENYIETYFSVLPKDSRVKIASILISLHKEGESYT